MQRMRRHVLNVLILPKRSAVTYEIRHRETAKIAAPSMIEMTHLGGSIFKLEMTRESDPIG
jgi:hypothetical protein